MRGRKGTPVTLVKDGMNCYFPSVSKASEFLKVKQNEVSMAHIRNGMCHGWKVKKGFAKPEPLREVIIQREIVYEQLKPRLRVNGLLTPNKTERDYYRYQERKNA